jgi:hypothetical protein
VGIETQKSISAWCDSTFGPAKPLVIARRAEVGLAELVNAIRDCKSRPEIVEEAADVAIILRRLCNELGYDLDHAVDLKMAKNRSREWNVDGNGDGRHK